MAVRPPSSGSGAVLRLWLLVALVAGFAGLRTMPPAPSPADAPATEFSAERAVTVLERIADDQSPHGVSTPANAAMADRIEAELRTLGLSVERQRAVVCRGIVCAPVVNLLAEVPGTHEAGPVVLLTSHYDSVSAGPGVADDLHGVALSIEIARALLAGEPPRHPVRLLIDEGEEVALLGAEAFVQQHPDASQVEVVVNVEARGTTGLSSMFQTSDGNGALVEAVVGALPRPFATSLAAEVYRRMPNDTDLSVFLEAGYAGVNFAFVGGVGRYHTPLDDLAHLDHGSVQHQGEGVLAAVRALADGPLPVPTTDDAVYADVLGLAILQWPVTWATAVPTVMLIVLVVSAVVAQRRSRLRPLRAAFGAVVVLGLLVMVVGASFGVTGLVAWVHGEEVAAHAHRAPLRLALWLTSAGLAWLVAAGSARVGRSLELAFGISITWCLGAIALAIAMPAGSVALVIPVGVSVAGLVVATLSPRHEAAAVAASTVGFVALWTQLSLSLEDAFGFDPAAAVAAPMAVALGPVVAALVGTGRSGPWPRRGLMAAWLATMIAACTVPVYDVDAPRRVALMHYEDRATGEAQVLARAYDGLSADLHQALDPVGAAPTPPPWISPKVPNVRAIPSDAAPPPSLHVDDVEPRPEGRRVSAHVSSPRGAPQTVLLMPSELVERVLVEGHPVATPRDRRGRLFLYGVPPEGMEIEVDIRGDEPLTVSIVDCVAELPESARSIVEARDRDGVPVHDGDSSCIATRATL